MKAITTFLISLFISTSVFAGPRIVGNGGDTFALQFLTYADKVYKYLDNSNISGLDVAALGKAIATAKVESTDKKLQLNGIPKDAINYPSERRIVFNRDRWTSFIEDERLALVLHEYLGLIGLEDASYTYSKLILKDMVTVTRIRHGSDSKWMLCQDDYTIVNFFERRGDVKETPNGVVQYRGIDLTMIYGNWVLIGSLEYDDTMSGPILLKSAKSPGTFNGNIAMVNDRLTMVGVLNLANYIQELNITLDCTEKYRR
jgi:hypothetical protein